MSRAAIHITCAGILSTVFVAQVLIFGWKFQLKIVFKLLLKTLSMLVLLTYAMAMLYLVCSCTLLIINTRAVVFDWD